MTYSVPFSHNTSVDGYSLKYKASTGLFEPQPSALTYLNPKDFGCPWDGINDDLPGLQAMHDSISIGHAARVVLPVGMGYCSDNFRCQRAITWAGNGGGNDGLGSGINFAPNKNFFLDNYYTAGQTGAVSDYSRFHNISITSNRMCLGSTLGFAAFAGINATRALTTPTAYKKGNVVYKNSGGANTVCVFRCTTAGITAGGIEPVGFSTTVPGTTITDGSIVWTAEGYATDRLNNTAYVIGQRHRVIGDCRYTYRCTVAGTTALSVGSLYDTPAYFGNTDILTVPPSVSVSGTSSGAGGVVRIQTSIAHNFSTNNYIQGANIGGTLEANTWAQITVIDSTHFDMAGTVFINAWTSGGTVTDYSKPTAQIYPQAPIVDGTAQFIAESHSAIVCMSQYIKIEDCYTQAFTCQSVHFVSNDTLGPNCDFSQISGLSIGYSGMGVFITGFNSNALQLDKITTFENGLGNTIIDSDHGAGSYTIWDRSLKNRFSNCYSQNCIGPAYYSSGNSQATWIDCYSENGYKDIFQGSLSMVFEPALLGINPISTSGMTVIGSGGRSNGISSFALSNPGGLAPYYGMGFGQNQANQHGTNEGLQYISEEYQTNHSSVTMPIATVAGVGWWSKNLSNFITRVITGESQYPALEGPGHVRDYFGRFGGYSVPYYNGVDVFAIRDRQIRGGQRIVGDRFRVRNFGASGTWDEIVCIQSGYQGIPWLSNDFSWPASLYNNPVFSGTFGTMVEPTANIVGSTINGQIGLAASFSAFINPKITLTGLTNMTPASIGRIITITNALSPNNNGSFVITDYISASSVIIANQAFTGSDGHNGSIHWIESSPAGFTLPGVDGYAIYGVCGSIPPAGKKVFQCSATTGTVVRGTIEPDWSIASTVGQTVIDGYVTWTLIGFTPEWALSSKTENRFISTTNQTHTLWADNSMTDGYSGALKSAVASVRIDGYTTTNSASQTIAILDNSLFTIPPLNGNLTDNASYRFDVIIEGKSPGTHAESGSSRIQGDYYIDSGNLTIVGVLTISTNFLGGSTTSLVINGRTLLVQVSPGINAAIGWSIIGTVNRRID